MVEKFFGESSGVEAKGLTTRGSRRVMAAVFLEHSQRFGQRLDGLLGEPQTGRKWSDRRNTGSTASLTGNDGFGRPAAAECDHGRAAGLSFNRHDAEVLLPGK